MILVCSTVLVFIWDQNSSEVRDVRSNLIVLMLIFVLEFAITVEYSFLYIYINELFPTQVQILGFGFNEIFGAMTLVSSKWLISFCLNGGIKIMIIFAVLAALSMVCSYFLPETRGKMPG